MNWNNYDCGNGLTEYENSLLALLPEASTGNECAAEKVKSAGSAAARVNITLSRTVVAS